MTSRVPVGATLRETDGVREVKLGRVVVGVDFAEPSAAAAAWTARHLAPGAELVLVHAVYVPEPPGFLKQLYPPSERVVDAARVGAEQQLRDLSRSVGADLIWPEVRAGKPDEVIAGIAAEYAADLIVVGPHAEGQGLRRRLGTTAERVLRRAHSPVLLARGTTDSPPRRLLAAVDGSEMTRHVLAWTEFLMRTHGSDAVLVHVTAPEPTSAPLVTVGADLLQDENRGVHEARRWLEEERRGLVQHERVTTAAITGRPAEAIVAEARARDSDLIILGNRGAGVVERFLFGSVAEAVLRETSRPVLVVTAEPRDPHPSGGGVP